MICQIKQPLWWFSASWSLLLLVPLFLVVPAAATGLPWRIELFAGVLFAAVLIWQVTQAESRNTPLYRNEFFYLVAPCSLFIAWSGFSVFWAQSAGSAAHHTLVWSCYLIFYLLIREIVNRPRLLRLSIYALGAAVWIISVPAIVEDFFGMRYNNYSTTSVRLGKFAEAINIIIPVFFAFALRLKGREFWLCAATIVLGWFLIMISISRAALGLGVIGICLFAGIVFLTASDRQIIKRLIGISAFLIILTVFSQVPSPLKTRMSTLERAALESTVASTNVRPLFAGVALEMAKSNPILGVGADNYGLKFDEYRAQFAAANPSSPYLDVLEYEIAERAHNEYLQVFAELGIVGGAIFAWFLFGLGFLAWTAFRRRRQISPIAFGALVGMTIFLGSSFVSSYSFRLIQNSFVFFFVVALAAGEVFRKRDRTESVEKIVISPRLAAGMSSLAIIASLALGVWAGLRAASAYFLTQALNRENIEEAAPLYKRAIAFDPENATAFVSHGIVLLNNNRFGEAAEKFQAAIQFGCTASACYSYLASAQALSGDSAAAEKTMAEAVAIYPRSVFARTRYAALLRENGKSEAAERELKAAFEINEKQAKGWWTVINEGAQNAALKANADKSIAAPMDLYPTNAVYAYLNEREILYPEEKIKF